MIIREEQRNAKETQKHIQVPEEKHKINENIILYC
jgi:hypothetical protein